MEEENLVIPSDNESGGGGGDHVNPTQPPSKKRKESSTSMSKTMLAVWQHFLMTKDNEDTIRGECKHCGSSLVAGSSKDGTSTLKHHLKICKMNPENKMGEGSGGSLQTWKFDSQKIEKALIEMIVVDELPFTFVEKYGFHNFMEAACPSFKIPSRYTVSRDIGELYNSYKLELKKYFRKSKQRVSLAIDTWMSVTGTKYMCITAHFIDENWKFHKKIISFKPITSDRGEDIGMDIRRCLYDWDIINLMSITADSESANDVAIEYVRNRMITDLFLKGQYLHMKCVSHIINLLVKDGLTRFKSSIDRVRLAVKYIRLTPSQYYTFKSYVAVYKTESNQSLHTDNPTRWDSTCDMLSAVVKLKDAFDLYELDDRYYIHDAEDGPPTNSDWHYLSKYSSILEVFKKKIEKVCGSTYVTSNMFLIEILDLDWKLRGLEADDDVEFREIGVDMRKKFNEYWGEVKELNMYMYFAIILDPRKKMSIVEYSFTKILQKDYGSQVPQNEIRDRVDVMVKQVEDALNKIIAEYASLYDSPKSTNAGSQKQIVEPLVSHGDNDFLNEFLMERALHTDTDLEIYMKEARVPNSSNFDILDWWKVNAPRFPILSKIAKDVFAIPISSVALESAFNTNERTLDAFRSSLGHSMVEYLICTQDWIRKSRKDITMDNDLDELEKIAKEITAQFQAADGTDE